MVGDFLHQNLTYNYILLSCILENHNHFERRMIIMGTRNNGRIVAAFSMAALMTVISLLIIFGREEKTVPMSNNVTTTSTTECRTSTTTTTTMKKSTTSKSTSTSPTTTTTTETTTVETEPVETEQIIGGDGTVTVNGWIFDSPIDAQYLYDRCADYGIDPAVMYGVMMAESTMGTACTNLCGITDVAAQSYNEATGNGYWNWESDPYQNLEISLYCLNGAYGYYGNGSTYDALAGYNTGYWGHIAGTYSPYAETVMGYADSVY